MRNVLATGMSGTGKWAADDGAGEWLWREDQIAELLATDHEQPLFVCRCLSNQVRFYGQFDAVMLLRAPPT
jgi:hypothetical protein